MSAILALVDAPAGLREQEVHRARTAALRYVYEQTGNWQTGPDSAGFELLLPALLDEGRRRELPLPYERFLGIVAQRDAKVGHIPPRLIYDVPTPLLHSLEYLGSRLDAEAIRKQLAPNGSFANSPSATAFFLLNAEDERPRTYLANLAGQRPDGGIPMVEPWEVFETAWVLYNLALAGYRPAQAKPHLQALARAMTDDGVGVAAEGLRPDADDTALTLSVLHRYGYPVSMGPLRPFEGINYYLTFPLERDASPSANAHVLEVALACAPFARQQVIRQKLVKFLRDARVDGDHWTDKWHASPFYATAHAVIALAAAAPEVCGPALKWLQTTQRPDGSWGWFSSGTAEETAYAVQAWLLAPASARENLTVDLEAAEEFLRDRAQEPVVPMWIGKTVYSPLAVVSAAILAAQILLKRRHAC